MPSSTKWQNSGTLKMAITDKNRRELFDQLEATLGAEPAATMMELLPQQPASDLVTRNDMDRFGAELRAELRGEMAELRGEMRALEGRFDSAFADLKVSTERLFTGAIAANVIAVVTALVT